MKILFAAALSLLVLGSARAETPASPISRWSEIVGQARGQTVAFHLWGGDDRINAWVSGWLADRLKADYDITLRRVGVADTAEVVNAVLSEKEAGVTSGGSVDLVWVNGANFRTLRQGGLLDCGWADKLPNAALIDWTDPSIATDFGTPVDGCEMPWSRAQFALAYDSARVPEPPRTVPALIDWIKAHPGRFAYPAAPDFNGSAFVRHVFYWAAGGAEALAGPFDRRIFDAAAGKTFDTLADIAPSLWRRGETYPTTITQLNQLFANGEVDFTFNYEPTSFGSAVLNGSFPATTRSYALDDGTIGNTSYVAIPFNAAHRAAALVTADFLASVEAQYEKARPDVWGMSTVLDLRKLSPADADRFRALPRHPSVVSQEELARRARPELSADWTTAIEKGWIARFAP